MTPTLTERQKQIIDMRQANVPIKSIAQQLGISTFTVKSTITKSRHKIAGRWSRQDVEKYQKRKQTTLSMLTDDGLTSAEVNAAFPEISDRAIRTMLHRMAHEGLIVLLGRGKPARWFSPQAVAAKQAEQAQKAEQHRQAMLDRAAQRQKAADEAYQERQTRARRKAEAKAVKNVAPVVVNRPTQASVSVKAASSAEVIMPKGLQVQRIPTPPGRFDVTLPKDAGVISQDWKARRLAEVQQ